MNRDTSGKQAVRLTPELALAALRATDLAYRELFSHGSLVVEIYKPEGTDPQQPHSRDEIYVIIAGSGFFVNGETRKPFSAGEVLFVQAGAEHRFEDFTADFSTWVMFYGPEGGEST